MKQLWQNSHTNGSQVNEAPNGFKSFAFNEQLISSKYFSFFDVLATQPSTYDGRTKLAVSEVYQPMQQPKLLLSKTS